jgi:ribosomal subunit interface protein
MDIRILGSNMDIGSALTQYATEHLNRHIKKYFDTSISADVHFSKQGNRISVNIIVNEGVKGGGIVIKSDGSGEDAYGCFNQAIEKVAKQLRRYKGKIKNYRRERGGLKSIEINEKGYDALKYIIANSPNPLLEEIEEEEEASIKQEENLKIISEKTTEIEKLTIEQAIMKMDLADLPALVFINDSSGRLNVVYYRKDGNISWIDPEIK